MQDSMIYPNWSKSIDGVKDRFEAMLPDLLKGIGITGEYTFPDGIMCPPSFVESKDTFVYELQGGNVWYRELVAKHTGMRIFIMKTRYGKAEFNVSADAAKVLTV